MLIPFAFAMVSITGAEPPTPAAVPPATIKAGLCDQVTLT